MCEIIQADTNVDCDAAELLVARTTRLSHRPLASLPRVLADSGATSSMSAQSRSLWDWFAKSKKTSGSHQVINRTASRDQRPTGAVAQTSQQRDQREATKTQLSSKKLRYSVRVPAAEMTRSMDTRTRCMDTHARSGHTHAVYGHTHAVYGHRRRGRATAVQHGTVQ